MYQYINKPLLLTLLLAVVFPLLGFCQNKVELRQDSANVCVLKLDYNTFKFNGGNLSYYQQIKIKDSLPISVNFNERNLDSRYITFRLETGDTIFNARYDFTGYNVINYPSVFSFNAPFDFFSTQAPKPSNIQYYDYKGNKTTVDSLTAQKIWYAIDSLDITNMFAAKDFKMAVYSDKPLAGPDHWIIFLVSSESSTGVNTQAAIQNIKIFPNPVNEYINIALPVNASKTNIVISDINGKALYETAVNKGESSIQIPVKSFAKGIYLLQVNTQEKAETYKILKQ